MSVSAHARFRDRLAMVAEQDVVAAALDERAGAETVWTRHFARFEPARPAWATLVHCSDAPAPLVLTTELFDEPGAAPPGSVATPAGPAAIRAFPADRRLPGLPAVLASVDRHQVVRYRPRRRCTLKVWTPDGPRFVKVLAAGDDDGFGPQVIAEARQLWNAWRSGRMDVGVAEPDRYDPATGAIWHRELAGRPIDAVLAGPGAVQLVRRLGAALGALARSGVEPARRTTRIEAMARTRRAIDRAVVGVPSLGGGLDELERRLAATAADLPPERPVPIHGAAHKHQWLVDGDQLGLVDFDRLAVGEPELDVGTFIAELEVEPELGAHPDELAAAFTDGFASSGVRLDERVVDWYRGHKRISKVARTTWALRPDGDQAAARHLARALAASEAPSGRGAVQPNGPRAR